LSNTTGDKNTATGVQALLVNTTGDDNTAIGYAALQSSTTTGGNTAVGSQALQSNTAGTGNVATGFIALQSNTVGFFNTGLGFSALSSNDTGTNNTATGARALDSNTMGTFNTANGFDALGDNTTGDSNVAIGGSALLHNQTGQDNIAIGVNALLNNISGNSNTAFGFAALGDSTGNGNIALGFNAGGLLTTGSFNIDIGNPGAAGESNTIRIGGQGSQTNTFIAGIFGTNVAGSTVVVDSNGHLGVSASSRRFKKAIEPMDKASEAILALKPVTFQYKTDTTNTPQFGLIAEQVADVNPDLVVHDQTGQIFTVRYDAVNAMLLNEFLKEHRKVEQQEQQLQEQGGSIRKQRATIEELKEEICRLTEIVKVEASEIQKVSARLQAIDPAATRVAADRR
jgi:endosialidase-like protein